jgi:hypothetical protein
MSLSATERVPQPMAIDAVVVNDSAARTLFVRLGDTVTGPARIAWLRGYQALVQSEASGYSGNLPDLWASTKTAERVAHGVPGDGGMLKFHFPVGNAAYAQLISKPRLTAIVTVDRATGYFLRCAFLHRTA